MPRSALLLCALLLAGCSAAPLPPSVAAPSSAPVVVPDLVGLDPALVDKTVAAAGVVAILDHVADSLISPGTVVGVVPPPGTAVPLGSTVTVQIAGDPGGSLEELAAADRGDIVGVTADPDGTLVVAAVVGRPLSAVRPALEGRAYRVVRCANSYAVLGRVAAEVSRRADLVSSSAGFSVAIDPAACAVRVGGDVPRAVAEALRAQYGADVVVAPGPAARRASS
ncbi:PASTA domain-containing protein [Spirilliplanes yamanashiensis]|uniref:PASTA domain-containing protein n=1 Tax=Spirilliplanes yamanashiensis TaxID=42233 RepID=A0A8J3Y8R9_9ACTN|nr:PASTA domain-containing protein [Spirilliplanes yamanashiensis]MDP9815831.1 hypothetical protein [Spirilliplanes yamanashiensis]GIJ04086.1 hypothetical protein Sya03_34380 [Spirilliplanes yamanashiensis]